MKKKKSSNIKDIQIDDHLAISQIKEINDSQDIETGLSKDNIKTSEENLKDLSKDELIKLLIVADKEASEYDNIIFEMRTLLQSGKGLGDVLNLSKLLKTFMAVIRERYNTINSSILLLEDFDPNNIRLRVRGFHGLKRTFWNGQYEEELGLYSFPVEDGLLWQIINQGDVFSVQNFKGMPRFKTAWSRYNLDVLQSDIWCPLIKKGEVKGILTLGLIQDGTQIPESERSFIQDLASIAVTNIDSVLKYEKNEIILRNIKTLYDVNQQLANVNDFKQLCLESLSTAAEALKAQKANLMLLDPETQKLHIQVVWGDIPESIKNQINKGIFETKKFKVGEGVAGMCAQKRKPIRENDRSKIIQVSDTVTHSIISVPLLRGDELVGIINMTNKMKIVEGKKVVDTLAHFSEDDETLLVGLADQAATNLHKSKLYNASITDKMTGLHNTRHFDHELDFAIEKAKELNQPLSLAISDIDNFKIFNDTYGHKAGDLVLIKVAEKLSLAALNDRYAAFRYGGEEFCLIMQQAEAEEAYRELENFRKEVEKMVIDYDGKKLQVTVSIGISTFPTDCLNARDAFLKADETLYTCKEKGRNQVRCFLNGKKEKVKK